MPVLALNGPTDHDTRVDPLPLHVSPWTAAKLEALIGGRSGPLTPAHLPALRELARGRVSDPDLQGLLSAVEALGEARVAFL